MSLHTYLFGLLTILRNVIAEASARDLSRIDFFIAIYNRLNRLSQRFERLYTSWQTNTLPKPRAPRPARPRATPSKPCFRFPTARMWLLRELKSNHANIAIPRMEYFLAMPELPEFLAAAPQAGRLLRPLCHMLGIEIPTLLALPRRDNPSLPKPVPLQNPKPPAAIQRNVPRPRRDSRKSPLFPRPT